VKLHDLLFIYLFIYLYLTFKTNQRWHIWYIYRCIRKIWIGWDTFYIFISLLIRFADLVKKISWCFWRVSKRRLILRNNLVHNKPLTKRTCSYFKFCKRRWNVICCWLISSKQAIMWCCCGFYLFLTNKAQLYF